MSLTVLSGLLAAVFYLLGSIIQWRNIAGHKGSRSLVFTFGFIAVIAHAVSALGVIKSSTGFHFGIFEISTVITLSISVLVLISSLRKPLENLFIGLFPLAIFSIIASLTITSSYPPTEMGIGLASHIILSIIAYSMITIAAMQAAFLAYQNYQLKHHHAAGLISKFPPLQEMEVFLFELLWVGEILLGLGIIGGFIFIEDLGEQEGVLHKTFFSILAWIVFAGLLWGRHQRGWRGRTAIRGTLAGFALLIIGFYGSKFVMEFILN
ncbi:MAG: cytochrome c biogenesis protein CcsA [Gammaproteobacteria bacterium]|nr:cytochrome c biogenesis protein CcsA [Gammaproteobacteria bacterium]